MAAARGCSFSTVHNRRVDTDYHRSLSFFFIFSEGGGGYKNLIFHSGDIVFLFLLRCRGAGVDLSVSKFWGYSLLFHYFWG